MLFRSKPPKRLQPFGRADPVIKGVAPAPKRLAFEWVMPWREFVERENREITRERSKRIIVVTMWRVHGFGRGQTCQVEPGGGRGIARRSGFGEGAAATSGTEGSSGPGSSGTTDFSCGALGW